MGAKAEHAIGEMYKLTFSNHSMETLADWLVLMALFQWPDDFPLEKPDGWGAFTVKQRRESSEGWVVYNALADYVPLQYFVDAVRRFATTENYDKFGAAAIR